MAYEHRIIEPKWQARWRESGLHRTTFDPKRPKFYALDMFPYPSGSGLHVGHCEGYTATDIITRWKRMQGFNVLHPMGWDAFGLPAENYAIKTGIHPRTTTEKAIANFRRQIDSIGFAYDWEREVNTTDPAYMKWTQWIFLQLYKQGLAYEGTVPINWCPSCKTGLANEEVTQGRCERCGTGVERKDMRQWLMRITRYAERLLEDLSLVDWPESTLAMQRNWIGRSEGAEAVFRLADPDDKAGWPGAEEVKVFTTRPDTLYGATYMVLSPEHPLVERITTGGQREAVRAYQSAARKKSDLERTDLSKEKTGAFTGAFALNPVNGEKTPVWIADYVLATYGTGAIMAVPAHDQRDYEFATKFGLPIKEVVRPADGSTPESGKAFCDEGINVNSGMIDGLHTVEAKKKICAYLEAKNLGRATISYRLRDWVFSRQRYWGEPIPIVHCHTHGTVPVPESELPVKLPEVERYEPTGTGESPLAGIKAWVETKCPSCGGPAWRETNTMPQWAGSCWYYLRYLDARNDAAAWSPEVEKQWQPVDLYVGGAEHAVLHLLYARFWHKVLFDLGFVSTPEPFKKLRHQGTVLAFSYQDGLGRYHEPSEVELRGDDGFLKATGEKVKVSVDKMAKTKLNGINPDDVVAQYGADVLRLYEMFMGEFELPKPWDPRAIEGCARFLKRVWRLVEEWAADKADDLVGNPERVPNPSHATAAAGEAGLRQRDPDPHLRLRHKTIKKVTGDLDRMAFNTAIAAMMEYVNELVGKGATRDDLIALVKLVGPFAPHVGDEAWEKLGEKGFLIQAQWPTFDPALTIDAVVTLAIQVNGKMRGSVDVARDAAEDEVRKQALAVPNVAKHLEGKVVRKVIVVPGRIVNIVVG
jgi:leucyl-tRNA synthetase